MVSSADVGAEKLTRLDGSRSANEWAGVCGAPAKDLRAFAGDSGPDHVVGRLTGCVEIGPYMEAERGDLP